MILNYYQPYLFPFLTKCTSQTKQAVESRFYHSFEDGLWHLLQHYACPKGSRILIPDFYCMDVVDNIKRHGYVPVFYPLDNHFQANAKTLRALLQKHSPCLLIIFHACGIRARIVQNIPTFLRIPKLLIVEDAVQRLTDPSSVDILHPRHFLMDSLRKVSPLPGSFLYGKRGYLPPLLSSADLGTYQGKTVLWFILFRIFFSIGTTVNSTRLVTFAHQVLLKRHDDIIGDQWKPTPGIKGVPFLISHMAFSKIQKRKREQVLAYHAFLSHAKFPWYIPKQLLLNADHLHVYPVCVMGKPDMKLLNILHDKGVVVWYKFTNAPWSRTRSVLFLPLGFHISKKAISSLSGTIINYWNSYV